MTIVITGGTVATAAAYLCTLAQCKAALGLADIVTSDALISDLITAATTWAQSYTRRNLVVDEFTEYLSPGNDRRMVRGNRIPVREYPIVSVTSIHEDANRVFGAETLIAAADYFISDAGTFVELYPDGTTRAFVPGVRTVKHVYQAGYPIIPADLNRAGVMLVVHLFHSADRQKQGIASESIGGHTLTYSNEEMPKEAKAILDRYVKPLGI